MAGFRHIARIATMQTIFAYEFREGNIDSEDSLTYIAEEFHPKLEEVSFAIEILRGVIKNNKKIIDVIKKFAPQWPIEKIAPVDRAVLEIGVFELLYSKDVPPVVAINEAIEIAKKYGDVNSGKFVNGVLSTVMSEFCKKEDKPKKEKKVKKDEEKEK